MDLISDVVVGFLIGKVIINGIVAHAIGKWLVKKFKGFAKKTPRTDAILEHYQIQALGNGHEAKSVLNCGQGKCAVAFSA